MMQRGPPSSRASSARLCASPRVTHVPNSTLRRIFSHHEGNASDVAPSHVNTVGSQTAVAMGEVSLLEVLVGHSNTQGVVTAAHARDVTSFRAYQVRVAMIVLSDESRQRSAVAAHEGELRALLQQLLVNANQCPTVALQKRGVGGGAHGGQLRHGSPGRLISGRVAQVAILPEADRGSAAVTVPAPPRIGAVMESPPQSRSILSPKSSQRIGSLSPTEEIEKLQDRILLLETHVRSTSSILESSTAPVRAAIAKSTILSRDASFDGGGGGFNTRRRLDALDGLEVAARQALAASEVVTRQNVALQMRVGTLEHKLRFAARYMLHAPFTSYRPKIPLANSLAGEEYLRRWILVETLQHYEDCFTLLQRHENDARNALEDEQDAAVRSIFGNVFLPHYVARCTVLEGEIDRQRSWAAQQLKEADALYAMLQLRVIVDEEATIRSVLIRVSNEAFEGLLLLSVELGQVRNVHALAKKLEGDLDRQRRRHNEEVSYLVSQLPRNGVIHSTVATRPPSAAGGVSPPMSLGCSPRHSPPASAGRAPLSGTVVSQLHRTPCRPIGSASTVSSSKRLETGNYFAGF